MSMKKTICFAVITALMVLMGTALFAEDFPSWYTEEVTTSEQEITRKNANGDWVVFIDKTYYACANVKCSDKIYSLEMARDAAEKLANEKLDKYLKSIKENDALKAKHTMERYKYNDSLTDGGAYVQVAVVVSKEKVIEPEKVPDVKEEISVMSKLPRILLYGSERLTLVDTLQFYSAESTEAHRVSLSTKEKAKGNKSKYSKSQESFNYPDGVQVSDTVYNLQETSLQFNLRNVVKGRKTVIIIRTDVSTDNEKLILNYKGNSYEAKITKDKKNRWRNIIFEIPEGEITEYTPQFFIEALKNNISVGSISVYQLL